MITLSIILAIVMTASFFIIRNLITQIQQIITFSTERMKVIDSKDSFKSDDEVGFFFKEVEKIQEALNEFTLK